MDKSGKRMYRSRSFLLSWSLHSRNHYAPGVMRPSVSWVHTVHSSLIAECSSRILISPITFSIHIHELSASIPKRVWLALSLHRTRAFSNYLAIFLAPWRSLERKVSRKETWNISQCNDPAMNYGQKYPTGTLSKFYMNKITRKKLTLSELSSVTFI